MLLLGNPWSQPNLLLAATVHEVVLISKVFVPTFTTIDLVPLPVPGCVQEIVAIPPVETGWRRASRRTGPACGRWPTGCSARSPRPTTPSRKPGCAPAGQTPAVPITSANG